MVAIVATNSATRSLTATVVQSRLEQARREADQAEANAQSLRSQADAAELEAQRQDNTVRKLSDQSKQGDSTYTNQVRPPRTEVPPTTQDFLLRMYNATSSKFAASGNALKSNEQAAPVVNSQGQSTGRILNLSA